MLCNVRKWIDKGHVAIDPDLFPELLTELRIATSDEEMSLDKSEYHTSVHILPILFFRCMMFHYNKWSIFYYCLNCGVD
jgi:hypothetical protein